MTNAQVVYEAIMRSKGHTNFSKDKNGRYLNTNLQTRWAYFLMGWEMRGVV